MVQTTAQVWQGRLLKPTLFNIFLERVMSDALEKHDGKVSIGGKTITNLQFADEFWALGKLKTQSVPFASTQYPTKPQILSLLMGICLKIKFSNNQHN